MIHRDPPFTRKQVHPHPSDRDGTLWTLLIATIFVGLPLGFMALAWLAAQP